MKVIRRSTNFRVTVKSFEFTQNISACFLSFVIGNWNAIFEKIKVRRRIFYRLHVLIACSFVLSSLLFIWVSVMYGVLILKQFDGDSKIGPLGWSMFDEVNGWRVADSNYKHEIEYEFAMAYYWNIALRRASNLGYSPF